MDQVLINAIKRSDPELIPKVFKEEFQRPKQWLDYLREYFGKESGARIEAILNKQPVREEKNILGHLEHYTDRWHAAGFQALYIACWIYQPLEKGSFMIKLTPQQLINAQRSVLGMGMRKSSHLTAQSYTAAGGALKHFSFIKGYDELLVILQDDWLFLKMEGEGSSHPKHWGGFANKFVTGSGFVSNQYLNELPKNNVYGIMGRAAENYNNAYEKLLEKLQVRKNGKMVSLKKVKGKMVTIRDTFDALMDAFSYTIGKKQQFAIKYGLLHLNNPNINVEAAITELLSIEKIGLRELKDALRNAADDIKGIVDAAKVASRRMLTSSIDPFDQIFQEVRVEPSVINDSLNEFLKEMAAPN